MARKKTKLELGVEEVLFALNEMPFVTAKILDRAVHNPASLNPMSNVVLIEVTYEKNNVSAKMPYTLSRVRVRDTYSSDIMWRLAQSYESVGSELVPVGKIDYHRLDSVVKSILNQLVWRHARHEEWAARHGFEETAKQLREAVAAHGGVDETLVCLRTGRASISITFTLTDKTDAARMLDYFLEGYVPKPKPETSNEDEDKAPGVDSNGNRA